MSTGTKWAPDLGMHGTQLPAGDTVGMAADEAPEEHDIILLDSSGNGVVADGSQVNLRAAGIMYPDKRSTASATAGRNTVRVWDGLGARMPMKSGDELTANDICVPVYISDQKEIAKSASASGVGRSILGLALGLDEEEEAVFWGGPIGQLLARLSLLGDNNAFARYAIADAAASTAISERVIGRVKVPGVVNSVAFTGAAVTADATDYATGTIAKRSALDSYAAATTIATFSTITVTGTGSISAFTPYAWTLSGTAANLRLIPGDVITLVTTKGGSGKSLTGSIDVFGKVI
jgi:hypothetical protein